MATSINSAAREDEIYPNSPLTDVACEVRFCGEMQVECERHRFWDKIRTEYPKILVPFPKEGQATALQHYRFRTDTDDRTVSVALNSLAYSETKYRGHDKYLAEFERLVGLFRETFPKLGAVKRVGWRYMNLMPFTAENGLLPLNRFLKFQLDLPSKLFERTARLDFQWVGRHQDFTTTVRLANVARKDLVGQEGLLLDIDYAKDEGISGWDDVLSLLKKARAAGRQSFEDMITDDYREYLRGKTL